PWRTTAARTPARAAPGAAPAASRPRPGRRSAAPVPARADADAAAPGPRPAPPPGLPPAAGARRCGSSRRRSRHTARAGAGGHARRAAAAAGPPARAAASAPAWRAPAARRAGREYRAGPAPAPGRNPTNHAWPDSARHAHAAMVPHGARNPCTTASRPRRSDCRAPPLPRGGFRGTEERDDMGIIIWLIVGGIVGWLASLIMRRDAQQGILLYIIVGIVGAVLAGWIFGGGINEATAIRTFLFSLIGAVILLAIVNLFTRGRVR